MKKLLYLFMFLYLGTWGELSAQMLLFKGTFEEALKKAQAEKKDLFVDFYADWCGPSNNGRQYIYTARSR
ncbi:MAG: thioredoxin family protein [Butyricimonas faecihominis]